MNKNCANTYTENKAELINSDTLQTLNTTVTIIFACIPSYSKCNYKKANTRLTYRSSLRLKHQNIFHTHAQVWLCYT